MLTARWRAARQQRSDAGMTLIELTVGMTLLVIVGAIALNFFVGTTKQANRVTDQSLNGANARGAINQIATVLRVADTPTSTPGYPTARFTTISATEIAFYSNVNTDRSTTGAVRTPPTKIDIKLVGGKLIESTYAPKNAYTTYPADYNDPSAADGYSNNYVATPISTTLLTGVTNSNVFTYCSSATDPATSCTVTTNPTSVAFVEVTLTTAGLSGETAQTVQSAVAITGAVL